MCCLNALFITNFDRDTFVIIGEYIFPNVKFWTRSVEIQLFFLINFWNVNYDYFEIVMLVKQCQAGLEKYIISWIGSVVKYR